MILSIDSASAACSVALIDGDRIRDERHELVGRGHAEKLVPMIADMLAGRRPSAILVDCGPGSFTGVRVGIAAAQGLGIGWRVAVSGYSSLALIAAALREPELAVALEGGHGQLFVQSFRDESPTPVDDLQSLTPEDAGRVIAAPVVAGSGADALVNARGWGRAVDAGLRAADARWLPEGLRALPPRPIYGRPPDARPMS